MVNIKKFLIFFVFFLISETYVLGYMDNYNLYNNLTFQGVPSSDIESDCGTWILNTTCRYSTESCLERTDAGTQCLAYIDNSTYFKNTTTDRVIKFWSLDNYQGDWGYGGLMYGFNSTGTSYFNRIGEINHDGVGQFRPMIAIFNSTGTIQDIDPSTAGYGSINWLWVVVNITNFGCNHTISAYRNSSETSAFQTTHKNSAGQCPANLEGYWGASSFRDFKIDDIEIWEISTGAPIPSMTVLIDLVNNTQNFNSPNLNISFNATFENQNTDIGNCSIYVNDVLNNSQTSLNLSLQQSYLYTFPVSTESWFNFTINCTTYESSDGTGYYFYNVDTIDPQINASINNNTEYLYTASVYFNFSFFDTNLFAYNITFLNQDKTVWNSRNYFLQNISTTSIINSTYISFVESDIANYSVRAEVWDSHTSKIIVDYPWYKYNINIGGNDYKGIAFANNRLNLSTDDFLILNNWTLIKTLDRYKLNMNFNTLNQTFDIYLGTNKQLFYLKDSAYKGHFIIGLKHWIDFQPQNENMISDFSVNYLSNNNVYRIRFKPQQETVIFNSIGDLNYISEEYFFTVINTTTVVVPLINTTGIENSLNNLTEGINMFWIIIFALVLIVVALAFRIYILMSIGSGAFFLIFLSMGNNAITSNGNLFYWAGTLMFFFVGIAFFIMGIVLQIMQNVRAEESNFEDKYFYPKY